MNFQNLGKIKIILIVIAVVLIVPISISVATSNLHKDNGQDDAVNNNGATQTTNTTTEYDVSKLGFFYNLDSFSDENGKCIMLEICGYDKMDKSIWFFSGWDEAFGWCFQNGYIRETENIELGYNYINKFSYGDEISPYRAINENEIYCTDFGEEFSIKSTDKITKKSAVYSCSHDFYSRTYNILCIPATMIDWSTKEYIYIDGKECIKYSVK